MEGRRRTTRLNVKNGSMGNVISQKATNLPHHRKAKGLQLCFHSPTPSINIPKEKPLEMRLLALDLHESQQCAGNGSKANHGPASHLHLLVGDTHGEIPGQMSEAVQAVECEWQADEELGEELGGDGPCAEGSGDTCALEVPTKGGGSEVCEAEEVEGTGKGNTSDTVQCRQVPGDLGFVDTEMRSDGAMKTLFGKDLSRCLIFGHGLSGGKSSLVNDAGRCDDGGLAGSSHPAQRLLSDSLSKHL